MKKFLSFIISAIIAGSILPISALCALAEGTAFYVSPNAGENGSGTFDSPFSSIENAKTAIRNLKTSDGLPKGGVTVYLRGGEYNIRDEILFTKADSGTAASPIVYKAYQDEKPVFSGGVSIKGSEFVKVTDQAVLAKITDENARNNIMSVSLADCGITDYGYDSLVNWGVADTSAVPPVEVFIGDTALDMARYPNKKDGRPQYLFVGDVTDNPYGASNAKGQPKFKYSDERIEKWDTYENTYVHGLFPWAYFFEGHKIEGADKENNILTLQKQGFYGISKGNRYYYINSFSELDCENEYYIDTKNQILYLYAPKNLQNSTVSLSVMGSKYNEAMFHFNGASYITLDGLEITLTRTHGVWIQGGTDVTVKNCDIKNIGLRGVTMGVIGFSENEQAAYVRGWRACDRDIKSRSEYLAVAGYNHGVDSCKIFNCGNGGVKMYGGDRAELEPCGYYLRNSVIHDVDRFHTTYGYAVFMVGVGIEVSHNTIYNTQQCAVQTACNDSVFEYNELYNCLTEGADMGIIYNSAWNGELETGFEIRYNYCHDTPNEIYKGEHDWAGDVVYRCFVYKDDGNSFQDVHHNLVVNVPRGVNNVGGTEVNWNNNVFVDVLKPINLGYQPQRFEAMRQGKTGEALLNTHGSKEFLKFAELPAWLEKHPEVKKAKDLLILRGRKAYYEQKEVMNNLIVYLDKQSYYTQAFSWAPWTSDYCTIYNNRFYNTDPGFKDIQNHNYEIDGTAFNINLSWLKMDIFGASNK